MVQQNCALFHNEVCDKHWEKPAHPSEKGAGVYQ